MPDPRSQILVNQLGDLPAIARLPQLSTAAVGRQPFRTNTLRSKATPYASDVLAVPALLPRNASSMGSPMQVDSRRTSFDGGDGVDPGELAERLRRVAAESVGTAVDGGPAFHYDPMDTSAPEPVDSPAVAPGGVAVHAPPSVVPQTPGGPVGTTAGGVGTKEAPGGYSSMMDALEDVLHGRRKVMAGSGATSKTASSRGSPMVLSTPSTPPTPVRTKGSKSRVNLAMVKGKKKGKQ